MVCPCGTDLICCFLENLQSVRLVFWEEKVGENRTCLHQFMLAGRWTYEQILPSFWLSLRPLEPSDPLLPTHTSAPTLRPCWLLRPSSNTCSRAFACAVPSARSAASLHTYIPNFFCLSDAIFSGRPSTLPCSHYRPQSSTPSSLLPPSLLQCSPCGTHYSLVLFFLIYVCLSFRMKSPSTYVLSFQDNAWHIVGV